MSDTKKAQSKKMNVEWPLVRSSFWSVHFATEIRWPAVETTATLVMIITGVLSWLSWYFCATSWFGFLGSIWFYVGLAVWLYGIRMIAAGPVCQYAPNLTGKVVIVTGSNTGIGLETARVMWNLGATVILACRDTQKAAVAQRSICTGKTASAGAGDTSRCAVMKLDVSSLASVKQFAEEFKAKHSTLHYLINNAGLLTQTHGKTVDGFETTIGTNYLGPFLLTHLLLPTLQSTASSDSNTDVRIVNVASIGSTTVPTNTTVDTLLSGLTADGKFSYFPAYAASKLAQVMMSVEMEKRFGTASAGNNNKGVVKSISLHPGGILTGIWQQNVPQPALNAIVTAVASLTWKTWWQGAQPALHASFAPDIISGAFYIDHVVHPVLPIAVDPVRCEELYTKSMKLVGLQQ